MPPSADLPPQVASELAAYLRSSLFAPLSSNITRLRAECESTISEQKDMIQDAQLQIGNVIEPTADRLIPIADDLVDVYAQIDLLEGLLARSAENIRLMTAKVETTEQAVRREKRALDDAKPLPLWKDYEPTTNPFRAGDYVESNGRLKDTTRAT